MDIYLGRRRAARRPRPESVWVLWSGGGGERRREGRTVTVTGTGTGRDGTRTRRDGDGDEAREGLKARGPSDPSPRPPLALEPWSQTTLSVLRKPWESWSPIHAPSDNDFRKSWSPIHAPSDNAFCTTRSVKRKPWESWSLSESVVSPRLPTDLSASAAH